MKWITHQAGAVAAGLALHLPLAGLAAACAGAVLPDMLDQRMAGLALTRGGRQRLFHAVHRGTTHWFGWWCLLCAAGFSASGLSDLAREAALGVGLGGLSHVLLDMLTPAGVPVLPFSRRRMLSLKLCSTGSAGELCFLAGIAALVWLFLREDVLQLARRLGMGHLF